MQVSNPKREFTINYDIAAIKKAVLSIISNEPAKYILVNDDQVLNQIRIKEKGILMDVGYHIDFSFRKKSDSETDVAIEVSRTIGAIDNKNEIHNSNYILKEITDKFSSYLSGKVDATGKAEIPKNDGCIGVFAVLIAIIGLVIFTFIH